MESQVDILAQIYEQAADRLRLIVENPPGGTAASQLYRQAAAAQQLVEVEAIARKLGIDTAKWIGPNLTTAVQTGLQTASAQAKEAGVSPGSFANIDSGAIVAFAHDIAADLNKASGSMATRRKSIIRDTAQQGLSNADIKRILAGGLIEGRPDDTIRKLRKALEGVHGKTVIVPTKSGGTMEFKVGYYARLVAVTQMRKATVHSRHERLKQMGMDLVTIIGGLSGNFCSAFLGQVFSLSGTHEKYAAYSSLPGDGPPFHPNCSKNTKPFVERLATDEQKRNAIGIGDAQKLLGMSPAEAQRSFKDLQIEQQVKAAYK